MTGPTEPTIILLDNEFITLNVWKPTFRLENGTGYFLSIKICF